MTEVSDRVFGAAALVALGTVVALAFPVLKAVRLWRRPPPVGSDRHALAPLAAALDPFRPGEDPAFAVLRPEQVAAVMRQMGLNLGINLANTAILVVVMAGQADPYLLSAWSSVVVGVAGRGLWHWHRNRNRPVPETVSKRTLRRMAYQGGLLGCLWGGGFALFYGQADPVGRIVLVALGMGMSAGGTVALSASPGAAILFAAGVLVPGMVRLLTTGHPGDPALAALCALYACSMAATLTKIYDSFARNVLGRAAQREQAETIALLLNTYEEHASGWLWRADRDGCMLDSPPRLERLLGSTRGGLLGRPLWTLGDDRQPDGDGWAAVQSDLRTGCAFRDRVVAARPEDDGATVWLALSGRLFADGNWRGIGTDVTARETALRALQQAMAAAAAGVEAKSRFLATVSHELRTPLNAIIGFADLIRLDMTGPLNPLQSEYLAHIHSSGTFLLRMVNELLDLSKADAGRLELEEESVDLPALVAEAIRYVAPQATGGRVGIDFDPPLALPGLRADGRRMLQVLLNLLSNAVKFTPPGGRVAIAAGLCDEGGLELVVADTGIGMATADIPKALEHFGQVDNRRDRHYEGSGLGLPLANRLVELHGGTLTIDSRVGIGTRVTIRLPASRTIRENAVAPPQMAVSAAMATG